MTTLPDCDDITAFDGTLWLNVTSYYQSRPAALYSIVEDKFQSTQATMKPTKNYFVVKVTLIHLPHRSIQQRTGYLVQFF